MRATTSRLKTKAPTAAHPNRALVEAWRTVFRLADEVDRRRAVRMQNGDAVSSAAVDIQPIRQPATAGASGVPDADL